MRTMLRIFPLVALMMTVAFASPARAASCEAALKAHYRCSATYDDGGSSEYCVDMDAVTPGDGAFYLFERGGDGFYCSCGPKGKAPNVRFGVSSREFLCVSGGVALSGKLSPTRITGQGYSSFSPQTRSSFTCQAVASCP